MNPARYKRALVAFLAILSLLGLGVLTAPQAQAVVPPGCTTSSHIWADVHDQYGNIAPGGYQNVLLSFNIGYSDSGRSEAIAPYFRMYNDTTGGHILDPDTNRWESANGYPDLFRGTVYGVAEGNYLEWASYNTLWIDRYHHPWWHIRAHYRDNPGYYLDRYVSLCWAG